jgi:hypothetical protein
MLGLFYLNTRSLLTLVRISGMSRPLLLNLFYLYARFLFVARASRQFVHKNYPILGLFFLHIGSLLTLFSWHMNARGVGGVTGKTRTSQRPVGATKSIRRRFSIHARALLFRALLLLTLVRTSGRRISRRHAPLRCNRISVYGRVRGRVRA